jgi:hypothetical protein
MHACRYTRGRPCRPTWPHAQRLCCTTRRIKIQLKNCCCLRWKWNSTWKYMVRERRSETELLTVKACGMRTVKRRCVAV